ncbi:MAG: AAA family ATPase [Alphaproteobacteria bacterium]|nr:AAA family ATPase [Alphaproteobacteria bacterium]
MAKSISELPHNLMAFVNDPVSEQVIWNVIKEMNIAYAEAKMGSVADALEFLKENRSPKVLIVDVSNSELPLGDIEKIKEFSAPNISIIVIGSRDEVGLFRDLKEAGVVDYIVKPLGNILLRRAIEQATGVKNEVQKEGKLIHVMSATGGAGATTVVANVGWLLANRRFKRTLIMDLDFLYGTANLLLDVKTENAYLDILESPDKIDDYFTETILRKCTQRLYYLGGLCDLVRGVQVDIDAFETLMTILKKQFNYILVDAQRDQNEINKISMKKADCFIIMVEMTMASAQNAARLLEFLLIKHSNKKIIIIDNKNGLSSAGAIAKESFEEVISRKIDYVMPLDETITLAAANIGQPLVVSDGPLTEILDAVTDDVLGKNENQAIVRAISEREGLTFDKVKNEIFNTIGKFMKK